MRISARLILCAVLIALTSAASPARPAGDPEPALAQRFEAYVSAYVALGDFSGCVLIARHKDLLYERCFGKADVELDVPNTPRTRFHVASISKQFTAAAILRLAERGVLSLHEPIGKHLKSFPHGATVTPHQLLTHTAGLRNSFQLERYASFAAQGVSLTDLVAAIGQSPLDFEPGSQHRYSNSGYIVLARLIETLSGQPYAEHMREAIFKPAGLQDTLHADDREIIPRRAKGYNPAGLTGVENARLPHPSVGVGAGSLLSSVQDLYRWHLALSRDGVLSEASRNKLSQPHAGSYGYGVAVYDLFERRVCAHDGRMEGFTADLSRYPDDGLVVVLLSNVQASIGDAFRRDLAAIALGKPYQVPQPRRGAATPPSTAALKLHAGEYEFGPGFVVNAWEESGRLFVAANQGGASELVALNDGRFFSRVTYAHVTFDVDEGGLSTAMHWLQDDNDFVGKRRAERSK